MPRFLTAILIVLAAIVQIGMASIPGGENGLCFKIVGPRACCCGTREGSIELLVDGSRAAPAGADACCCKDSSATCIRVPGSETRKTTLSRTTLTPSDIGSVVDAQFGEPMPLPTVIRMVARAPRTTESPPGAMRLRTTRLII